jgi:hypothetical protein
VLSLYLWQALKFWSAYLAVILVGQVLRHAIHVGSSGWMAVLAGVGLLLIFGMGGNVLNTMRFHGIAQDERVRVRIRGRRW